MSSHPITGIAKSLSTNKKAIVHFTNTWIEKKGFLMEHWEVVGEALYSPAENAFSNMPQHIRIAWADCTLYKAQSEVIEKLARLAHCQPHEVVIGRSDWVGDESAARDALNQDWKAAIEEEEKRTKDTVWGTWSRQIDIHVREGTDSEYRRLVSLEEIYPTTKLYSSRLKPIGFRVRVGAVSTYERVGNSYRSVVHFPSVAFPMNKLGNFNWTKIREAYLKRVEFKKEWAKAQVKNDTQAEVARAIIKMCDLDGSNMVRESCGSIWVSFRVESSTEKLKEVQKALKAIGIDLE